MLRAARGRAVAGALALHLAGLAVVWGLSQSPPRVAAGAVVAVTLVTGAGGAAGGRAAPEANPLENLGRRLAAADVSISRESMVPAADSRNGLAELLGPPDAAAPPGAVSGDAGAGRSDPYLHASGARLARAQQMEAALRRAAERCWDRPASALPIRVRVSLDARGAPRGTPAAVGPGDGSPARRDAERRAAAAVTGCAPFDLPILGGEPHTVELIF